MAWTQELRQSVKLAALPLSAIPKRDKAVLKVLL